jgi:Uma2 family endonuclease
VETKLPLYARNEIPELWVFDVQAERLQTYRKPVGLGYDEVQILATPGGMPITALRGVSVDLSAIFP